MVENSKLFAKHLADEGIVIIGNEKHRRLLNSFFIKRDLLLQDRDEFIESVCHIGWVPPGINGLRWACDYMYTLARNIIYLSNALDGFFHFGYQEAVRYFLSKKNANALFPLFLKIRLEKYRYRTGYAPNSHFDIKALDDISEVLAGRPVKLKMGGVSTFSGLNPKSYEFLRLVERGVVNKEFDGEQYLDRLRRHGEYSVLLRRQAHLLAKKADQREASALTE